MISWNHKWETLIFPKIKPVILKPLLIFFIASLSFKVQGAKYCLTSPTPSNKSAVESKLAPFLKPSELIEWQGDCFMIPLSSGRDILFQKLIGEVTSYTVGSDVVLAQKPCELQLIEETKKIKKKSQYKIGRNSILNKNVRDTEGQTTSRLLLTSGRPGRIYVEDTYLELVCTVLGMGQSAEIEFWLVGQRGLAQISTTLTFRRGQKQFLAEVIKEMKEKNKGFSLKKGVGYAEKDEESRSEFFLLFN